MAKLVHEIWITADGLPGCVLAGPMGDGARRLMAESRPPRLPRRFVAESHSAAMTVYNRILGREPYESDFAAQDNTKPIREPNSVIGTWGVGPRLPLHPICATNSTWRL
jgi:hypothetical protein